VNTDFGKTTNRIAPPTDIYNKTISENEGVVADESMQNFYV
jgi:hypothetical protein